MINKKFYFAIFLFLLVLAQAGWVRAESYIDLSLKEAVDVAKGNNRNIAKAREEDFRADFRVTEAASAAYPTLNGFWDFDKVLKPMIFIIEFPDPLTGIKKKNRFKAGTDHSMGLGASLSQNLYMGGKVGTALKAARIYKKISSSALHSVKQNVIAGVVQAFNSVLLAKEMFRISQESIAQGERNLKNVQAMFDAGTATEYDLLRARVRVANMKPALLNAKNQETIAQLKLKEVMGISPDEPVSITGSFSEPDTSLLALAEVKTALDQRPDLRASEFTVDLYDKNIKIVRGEFLPTLTAGSTFQYMGNFDTFKYDAEDWNPYWTASLNLSFPIFSGFRNSARYKQAKVDYYNAKTDLRTMHDSVLIEVQESVLDLRKAVETIESQRMNVKEAEKALEMAESLYANGRATQLEVLDAQLALEHAKTNMVSALYDGTIAEIMLKKSLGIVDIEI
ncbi:TolC family protein [Candidatus Latescibacterota bacterium]